MAGRAPARALKNPRRGPCSPSRRSGSAPDRSGRRILWQEWCRRARVRRAAPRLRQGRARRRATVGGAAAFPCQAHRLAWALTWRSRAGFTRDGRQRDDEEFWRMKSARKARKRRASAAAVPGLAVRRAAATVIDGVLRRRRPLDELLDDARTLAALDDRDRALARGLVGTGLRRVGSLRHLVTLFVERGLPAQAPLVETALLIGAAQILFLDVPDHAAVDLSVRLVQGDRHAARFAGLVNAVL